MFARPGDMPAVMPADFVLYRCICGECGERMIFDIQKANRHGGGNWL